MFNQIIRNALIEIGIKYCVLARVLGISDASLFRCLMSKSSVAEQARIAELIQQHGGGGDNDHS